MENPISERCAQLQQDSESPGRDESLVSSPWPRHFESARSTTACLAPVSPRRAGWRSRTEALRNTGSHAAMVAEPLDHNSPEHAVDPRRVVVIGQHSGALGKRTPRPTARRRTVARSARGEAGSGDRGHRRGSNVVSGPAFPERPATARRGRQQSFASRAVSARRRLRPQARRRPALSDRRAADRVDQRAPRPKRSRPNRGSRPIGAGPDRPRARARPRSQAP